MVGYVTCFLFSVLVLGHLSDHKGRAWRREMTQMYCIEMTVSKDVKTNFGAIHQLCQLFPSALCHPPKKEVAISELIGQWMYYLIDISLLHCLALN